jgi:hypothetical protein
VRLADLVVLSPEPKDRDTVPAAWPRCPAAGVFTSTQSIVAFPVSVSVVATIARASHTIGRTAFDAFAVPLAAAFIVGALLVGLTMTDSRARPQGLSGWAVAVAIAIVNSLVLFAAALGIEKF